jgi:hypothetical protein
VTDSVTMPPTVRLLASLLPATWPDRLATLAAAARLDAQHHGNALDVLLDAWHAWHRRGEVPQAGPLRDLIAVLAALLGGVAHELRRQPRESRGLQGRRDG